MKSEDWFPTRIWYDQLNLDNTALKEYCLDKEQNEENDIHRSNQGGYHSEDFVTENLIFSVINNEVFTRAKDILVNDYNITKGEPYIQTSWFIVNRKHHYNVPHTHPGSFLSAAYYIAAPEGSPPIFFEDSRVTRDGWESSAIFGHYNDLTYSTVTHQAEEGKLLMFPSWVKHAVGASQIDEPRICLAYNIGIKWDESIR